jgi:hypothetical protein
LEEYADSISFDRSFGILQEPHAILEQDRYVENKTNDTLTFLQTALKLGIFYSFKIVLCSDSNLKYTRIYIHTHMLYMAYLGCYMRVLVFFLFRFSVSCSLLINKILFLNLPDPRHQQKVIVLFFSFSHYHSLFHFLFHVLYPFFSFYIFSFPSPPPFSSSVFFSLLFFFPHASVTSVHILCIAHKMCFGVRPIPVLQKFY